MYFLDSDNTPHHQPADHSTPTTNEILLHIPLPTLHDVISQRHPWMELDWSSFTRPHCFKFHFFSSLSCSIVAVGQSWTRLSTCLTFLVHLRCRLKTESPNVFASSFLFSVTNRRVYLWSSNNLVVLLPTSSCLDSSLAVVSSLLSLSHNGKVQASMRISYDLQQRPSNICVFSNFPQYFLYVQIA